MPAYIRTWYTCPRCAQCHHHPYEKWSQDDYWSLAAFYGRVAKKTVQQKGVGQQNQQNQKQVMYVRNTGNVINKRTTRPAPHAALGRRHGRRRPRPRSAPGAGRLDGGREEPVLCEGGGAGRGWWLSPGQSFQAGEGRRIAGRDVLAHTGGLLQSAI